jgi:hypothetical protein
MGNIWSAERGQLSISVSRELLNMKINSNLTCTDFYDIIKSNKSFLSRVVSSEKCVKKSSDDLDLPGPGPSK